MFRKITSTVVDTVNETMNYVSLSPTPVRVNKVTKTVDEFFIEYFNKLFVDKYQGNTAAIHNLENIAVEGILTTEAKNINIISNTKNTSTITKDIIAYLLNNSKVKLNTFLIEPIRGLQDFIPIKSLDFSGRYLKPKEVKYLANYLRNSITIEQVKLEDCGINDKGVRYLADNIVFNKNITSLSLVSNDQITNIGIKTLLKLVENNNTLTELKILLLPQRIDNEVNYIREEINICNENKIHSNIAKTYSKNLDFPVKNKNFEPKDSLSNSTYTDAGLLLELITKSHHEIVGKNVLDKVLILLGMRGSGMTVLGYQLSDLNPIFEVVESPQNTYKLGCIRDKDDKKIRHDSINNNPNNQYRVVNNFLHDKESINIIECSGINSRQVNPIQKILDYYTYWQILELATGVKFGLIIRDNSDRETIESAITQFTNFFKEQGGLLTSEVTQQLKNALFCIVTFATECGSTQEESRRTEIEKKIKTIKGYLDNSSQTPNQKFIVSQLINSIHLFKKAISGEPFSETLNINNIIEGNNPSDNNELNNNANNTKWSTLKEIYIKPFSERRSEITLPKALLNLIDNNILAIGKIIMKFFQINKNFINDPLFPFYNLNLYNELNSEAFAKHYDLIERYLPRAILNKDSKLSEAITSVQKVNKTYFSALRELTELKDAYNKYINEPSKMICEFLEIIRKFYSIKNTDLENQLNVQAELGNYIYLLKQHWKVLLFCEKILPQLEHLKPLKEVVEIAKKYLIDEDLLNKAIIHIKLNPYQQVNNIETSEKQVSYYKEALDWLNSFNVDKFLGVEKAEAAKKAEEAKKVRAKAKAEAAKKSIDKAIATEEAGDIIKATAEEKAVTTEKAEANFKVNEMKATAHYYLGMLYKNNSSLTDNNTMKLYWLLAIREYIEALKIELTEYFEPNKTKKDYSFHYGDYKTAFVSVCDEIGKLLLTIGRFFKQENQNENATNLIKEAMQYFKISVNTAHVVRCEQTLLEIFQKQPEIEDKSQKELCISLGEFLLKLGFSTRAAFEFDKARSLAEFEEKEDLLLKVIRAKEINVTTNSAFHKAMYTNGKMEDLSIFQDKRVGKIFLEFTKNIVLKAINLPEESQHYVDSYEPPQPQKLEQPQLVQQSSQQKKPPIPSAVKMPPNRQHQEDEQNKGTSVTINLQLANSFNNLEENKDVNILLSGRENEQPAE